MGAQSELIEQDQNLDVYSVTALLSSAGLQGSAAIRKSIGGYVRVYGRITKLQTKYPKSDYFTLTSSGGSIACTIPKGVAVQEGADMIMGGTITLQPSRFSTGLDVVLDGLPLDGELGIKASDAEVPVALPVKAGFTPLSVFLRDRSLGELLVMGSLTGLSDVKSRLTNPSQLVAKELVTSSESRILKKLHSELETGAYSGVAIVRGGDDQTLDFWDDPKFIAELLGIAEQYAVTMYAALGHAHRQPLAYQYLDQGFGTPTALGDELQGIMLQCEIRHENRELSKSLQGTKSIAIFSMCLCVVLSVVVAALLFTK